MNNDGRDGRNQNNSQNNKSRPSNDDREERNARNNQRARQPRRGRGGRNPGSEGRATNVSENATESQVDMEPDTTQIARAVRNANGQTRSAPPSGFTPNSSAEDGSNDNTNRSQQPSFLPTAVMRSNEASQDDQMPVGRVVGLVSSPTHELEEAHQENVRAAHCSSRELLTVHQQNIRAVNTSRLALHEARMLLCL